MSRLEEIIAVVNSQSESVRKLSHNDLNWLIQQAERVKELESYCEKSANFINQVELEIENQRYKQALEEILGLDIDVSIYDYSGDVITIAAEALKGDKP